MCIQLIIYRHIVAYYENQVLIIYSQNLMINFIDNQLDRKVKHFPYSFIQDIESFSRTLQPEQPFFQELGSILYLHRQVQILQPWTIFCDRL